MGTILLHQTFPFAIGLSIRRTDYYWGTAAISVIVTLLSSILLMPLSIIETKFTEGWGVSLHYFNLPYLSDGSILEQMWISFVLLLFFFYLGFVTASVHRRYGKIGLLLLSVAAFLASSLGIFLMSYYKWWGSLFTSMADLSAFQIASWTFPITLILAGISYLLLRRSTV
ncbi:hypothetical protein NNL21_22420 [Paenibacillus mendelii]|nr:hypothetical protein [Paenibacillus mendelii]